MSQEAVRSFYNKVLQDRSLQERFKSAPNNEAFVQLAVSLGSESGFTFTADDVRAQLKKGPAGSGTLLSDHELAAVTGGGDPYKYTPPIEVKNPDGVKRGST